MSSNSEAYEEGFHFGPHYDNPYSPSSREYDDFERGWTQRLKRSSSGWGGECVIGRKMTLAERYSEPSTSNSVKTTVTFNGYAHAKQKG